MRLSELKEALLTVNEVKFTKEDGTPIPSHFHITEIGQINKQFIDCGGTTRSESTVSMQLWESIDFWHRLEPSKLLSIINLSEEKLGIENHDVEVEYQSDTIGKYDLTFEKGVFLLQSKKTTCLASDACGIPSSLDLTSKVKACCMPGGDCC